MSSTEIQPLDREPLTAALLDCAWRAGGVTMRHRAAGFAVEHKADRSVVTAADREAEAVILATLRAAAPGIAVVAEEESAAGRQPETAERFFLVDPLDGTREYVNGGEDFTVNIALIEAGAPTLGIVYAPAVGWLYWGDTEVGLAFRAEQPVDGVRGPPAPIACRQAAPRPRAVASKSHATPETEAYLEACGAGDRLSIGSSLKFLLVAAGEADLYPRAGPTMEWDTAAGDAVLRAAGGMTHDLSGAPLRYGKPHFFNPGFVAIGRGQALPLAPFFPNAQTAPEPRP